MRFFELIFYLSFTAIMMIEFVIGLRFITADRIMDYHQIAMGVPWANLGFGVQTMSLNFLRTAGLGFLLQGFSIGFFLAVFKIHQSKLVSWFLLSLCLAQSGMMISIVTQVRYHTPAAPPLTPFILLLFLSLIGFLAAQKHLMHPSPEEK